MWTITNIQTHYVKGWSIIKFICEFSYYDLNNKL